MQSVIFAKNGSWPVATSASRSTRRAPPSIQGGTVRPECRCAPPTAGQIEAHSAPPSRSCSGAGVGRQGGRRGAYLVREQVRDATRRRCACARRYVVNAERVRRGGEGDVAPGVWGGACGANFEACVDDATGYVIVGGAAPRTGTFNARRADGARTGPRRRRPVRRVQRQVMLVLCDLSRRERRALQRTLN